MSFHDLTAALDYPMFVVTASSDGERSGCLVGFATQVSIDPPRYLVCLSHTNHTYRVAQGCQVLGVHALERHQRPLAELFGTQTGDEIDKFSQCRWEPGPEGVALLVDCPNRFVGRIVHRVDLGDHSGFVLDVIEPAEGDASVEPLMFQQVRDLQPGHGA